MQKVRFYLKPRRKARADGNSLVYLSMTIDGRHQDINLQYFIPLKNWDFGQRKLKAGKGLSKLDALAIEQELERILERTREIWREARRKGECLDHTDFETRLSSDNAAFNLISFCREYVDANLRSWSPGTKRIYADTVNWLEKVFGPRISTQDISTADGSDFYERFEKGMFKELGLNTRKKHHKHLQFFLGRARKAGFQFKDPYEEVSIGTIKGNRNFLSLTELERAIEFYQKQLLKPHQLEYLRQFLFSCFTGARYSDMLELTHKDIVGNELHYIAVKTARYEKKIEAPIPEVARALLLPLKPGKLFEMKTDQVTNRSLKEIFRIIGINKNITFHCARHTFGTLYIYLGGDITNLQQIMGHSKIETTQIYTHLAKRMDAKEQDIFDKEFAEKMKVVLTGKWKIHVA